MAYGRSRIESRIEVSRSLRRQVSIDTVLFYRNYGETEDFETSVLTFDMSVGIVWQEDEYAYIGMGLASPS